jgi:hypothetical protein
MTDGCFVESTQQVEPLKVGTKNGHKDR